MSAEFQNSVTVIMAVIANLIEVLKLNHQVQREEQARQSRRQVRQHAYQMVVLREQTKAREVEMKHLIKAAQDGAKGSSKPVASFQPFDSSSELWLEYLERFRTFLTVNFIAKEKEAQLYLTYQTTVTYKLPSNLAAQQPAPKGI